jgi:hypothetical protein
MFDTTKQIRRKYSFSDGIILIEEEATERAVYSDVQQIEKIHIFILNMSPKIWIEKGDTFEEMYEELKNAVPLSLLV